MGDLNSDGSHNELTKKRGRPRAKKGESTNKDGRLRAKKAKFLDVVGEMVKMISGDKAYEDYQQTKWDLKINSIIDMMDKLKKAAPVLQNHQLILEQSNSVPAIEEAFQEVKKDSQYFGEELKQMMDILEQKHQSIKEARIHTFVVLMLQKVINSCCTNIGAYDILNQDASKVEGHRGEQLRIKFPRTLDSFQTNQKGKNAEVHNQEEKQGSEVTLTLQLGGGVLEELTLSMKLSNQEMKDVQAAECGSGPSYSDMESLTKLLFDDKADWADILKWSEGNLEQSPNTCLVEGYKVLSCNASVLTEIFQKHPDTAKKFELKYPDHQSPFMNSLAKVYQNILKSNEKMLELEEIKNMDEMIQDMEHNGLQLKWLKGMLAEVREKVEDQEKEKKLQKQLEEAKHQLEKHQQEMINKKRRFL